MFVSIVSDDAIVFTLLMYYTVHHAPTHLWYADLMKPRRRSRSWIS